MEKIIQDLFDRDLVNQTTEINKLNDLLKNKTNIYCGFDPTADSLHIGSLLPLITLLRFKLAGFNVVPLIGGATGMIGDPSFKKAERSLNDIETIIDFKRKIISQISSFLSQDHVVDNIDWIGKIDVLTFLRDFGKHFSVNNMMRKDSVKSRIENSESGISFTEFSYQIIQSADFLHLFKHENCGIQVGGSDQWGNITSGIDLIHRVLGNDVNVGAITTHLLTKSDGEKFGKSESGTVWLDPVKTSPFDFHQSFLKISDSDIEKIFKMLSLRPVEEINKILLEDQERGKPLAQSFLADEITELVHGKEILNSILRVNSVLFSGDISDIQHDDFKTLLTAGVSKIVISRNDQVTFMDILSKTKLAESRTKFRNLISSGAIKLNGVKFDREIENINDFCLDFDHELLFDRFLLVQKGKRNFCLVEVI